MAVCVVGFAVLEGVRVGHCAGEASLTKFDDFGRVERIDECVNECDELRGKPEAGCLTTRYNNRPSFETSSSDTSLRSGDNYLAAYDKPEASARSL